MPGFVRDSVREDALEIAYKLRAADLAEIKARSGRRPQDVLLYGYHQSNVVKTICAKDGDPIGMFGAGDTTFEGVGCVWLLSTDELFDYRWQFLRESRKWFDDLNKRWPCLWNYVYAENTMHIKWLSWLGCDFVAYHPQFGRGKAPFWEFVRFKPHVRTS